MVLLLLLDAKIFTHCFNSWNNLLFFQEKIKNISLYLLPLYHTRVRDKNSHNYEKSEDDSSYKHDDEFITILNKQDSRC